jgi:hypothetical protein
LFAVQSLQADNGTMWTRQVQVAILGAASCAVLSVALQGATRWTLIGIGGALALWAAVIAIKKPPPDKYPAPEKSEPIQPATSALPSSRPIIVPIRYGKITSGPEAGHSGISLRNDGEPAYSVSAQSVTLSGLGTIHMDGTPQHLKQGEPELSFPSWRQSGNSSRLGSGLYYFMVEHQLDSITIPVTYRDADFNWYQTDVLLIKDQMARSNGSESGIRVDWEQKKITTPSNQSAHTGEQHDLPSRLMSMAEELEQFLKGLGPEPEIIFRSGMSAQEYTDENKAYQIRSNKMEAMYIRRFQPRVIDIYNEACELGTVQDAELERLFRSQRMDHDDAIKAVVARLRAIAGETFSHGGTQ